MAPTGLVPRRGGLFYPPRDEALCSTDHFIKPKRGGAGRTVGCAATNSEGHVDEGTYLRVRKIASSEVARAKKAL